MKSEKDKNANKLKEIDIMTGEYVRIHYDVVRPSRRVFGAFIDLAVLIILHYIFIVNETDIRFILYKVFSPQLVDILIFIIFTLLLATNMMIEYITHGKTLGKMLMGTVVVTNECLTPTFSQCFVRWLLFPIDFMLIGILLIDHYGARLGDLTAGCVVVYGDSVVHTKVDLDVEFRFAEPNYKPKFTGVENFTPNEMNAIRRVLYVYKYKVYTKEVAKLVREKLGLNNDLSDHALLHQVMQDCLYYKNLK